MGTAAQLMVRCLENEGVSVVFGIPGEENSHRLPVPSLLGDHATVAVSGSLLTVRHSASGRAVTTR
jgi:hypothetical protein